jgi:PAS domain S-box-containing protein
MSLLQPQGLSAQSDAETVDLQRLILKLLDADQSRISPILHEICSAEANRLAFGYLALYHFDPRLGALRHVFEHQAHEDLERTTGAVQVDCRSSDLENRDAFVPDPIAVLPPASGPATGPSTSMAFVIRRSGHLSGVLIAAHSEPRLWSDHAPFHQLGDVLLRASARKRQLEHYATESHLLNALMQNLPDAIYFKDLQSRFIRASRQVLVYNGFHDDKELIGKTDFDLFTDEHARQAFQDEQSVIQTGIPIIAKEEAETWPDGRITWALTTKMPFRDEDGNIIGTFGMSRDITQLRETQLALLEHQEMLRQRYQAMENDLAQARVIQMALLPQAPPQYDQLRIRFRYEPLDAVGGDFFSFRRLPDGGLAVFLGDLTGHGVSAALFMSLVRCMTERVFETDGTEPADYVHALDVALKNQIPNGFITAVYAVLQPRQDGRVDLSWCGAGHPDPIIWKEATGTVEQLQGGDGAIGIFDQLPREKKTLVLEKGDRLYLYTDGIPETRTAEGEMLGFDNVKTIIADSTGPDLEETLDRLMRRVRLFKGDAPAEDDIALIAIEVT